MCGRQLKLCDPLVTHESYLSALSWWYTTIKRYINTRYFTLHCDVPCHGLALLPRDYRVRPSGRLLSSLVRPVGSLEAGMLAADNDDLSSVIIELFFARCVHGATSEYRLEVAVFEGGGSLVQNFR